MAETEAASKVSRLLTENRIQPIGKSNTGETRAILNFIKERDLKNPTTLADIYFAAKKQLIDMDDLDTAELVFLNDIRHGI